MKNSASRDKLAGENHYTKKEGYVEKRGGPTHHMKQECHKKYGAENPMADPLVKAKHAVNNKQAQNREGVKEKKSIAARARWQNSEFKKDVSLRIKAGNTPEVRLKRSLSLTGKKQKVIICPHCKKAGGNNMKRFHFDNCKFSS